MGSEAATEGKWEKAFNSLDNMVRRLDAVAKGQKQMIRQQMMAVKVAEEESKEHDLLFRKIAETNKRLTALLERRKKLDFIYVRSQRLLREASASFKPTVQSVYKTASSNFEQISLHELEILKKTNALIEDNGDVGDATSQLVHSLAGHLSVSQIKDDKQDHLSAVKIFYGLDKVLDGPDVKVGKEVAETKHSENDSAEQGALDEGDMYTVEVQEGKKGAREQEFVELLPVWDAEEEKGEVPPVVSLCVNWDDYGEEKEEAEVCVEPSGYGNIFHNFGLIEDAKCAAVQCGCCNAYGGGEVDFSASAALVVAEEYLQAREVEKDGRRNSLEEFDTEKVLKSIATVNERPKGKADGVPDNEMRVQYDGQLLNTEKLDRMYSEPVYDQYVEDDQHVSEIWESLIGGRSDDETTEDSAGEGSGASKNVSAEQGVSAHYLAAGNNSYEVDISDAGHTDCGVLVNPTGQNCDDPEDEKPEEVTEDGANEEELLQQVEDEEYNLSTYALYATPLETVIKGKGLLMEYMEQHELSEFSLQQVDIRTWGSAVGSMAIEDEVVAVSEKGEGEAVVIEAATSEEGDARCDAGCIIDLDVEGIIDPPTAAAWSYEMNNEGLKAVFDQGEENFNDSNGVWEVKTKIGDTVLGGEEFDNTIMKPWVSNFNRIVGIYLSQNRLAWQMLYDLVEKAKVELSSTAPTGIKLPLIKADPLGAFLIYCDANQVASLNGIEFSSGILRIVVEQLNLGEPVKSAVPDKTVTRPDEYGFPLHQGLLKKGEQCLFWNNLTLMTKLRGAVHDSAWGVLPSHATTSVAQLLLTKLILHSPREQELYLQQGSLQQQTGFNAFYKRIKVLFYWKRHTVKMKTHLMMVTAHSVSLKGMNWLHFADFWFHTFIHSYLSGSLTFQQAVSPSSASFDSDHEVKLGTTVSCEAGNDFVIHLSKVALGETKKGPENVIVFVKAGDKKLVIGTLSADQHPQISGDLLFEEAFELSHNPTSIRVRSVELKALPDSSMWHMEKQMGEAELWSMALVLQVNTEDDGEMNVPKYAKQLLSTLALTSPDAKRYSLQPGKIHKGDHVGVHMRVRLYAECTGAIKPCPKPPYIYFGVYKGANCLDKLELPQKPKLFNKGIS